MEIYVCFYSLLDAHVLDLIPTPEQFKIMFSSFEEKNTKAQFACRIANR